VSIYINEPGTGELISTMNQAEAYKKICPFSMSNPEGPQNCLAAHCHGWRFLPGQHDARTAVGFCGMAA
jgi:hypothetical protein